MTEVLLKKFVKNYGDISDPQVRERYGIMSAIVGIVCNVLLCVGKFMAGTLAGSVSITADAVNNLSDTFSNFIVLVSVKLAATPADEKHPFGHARIEYIASLAVALLIGLLGVELIKSSYQKILHPDPIGFSYVAIGVLSVSIVVKLWMCLFNRKLGKRIDSSVLLATATDSLSDVAATSAVLIAAIVSPIVNFPLDGYMGVVVALFILYSGYCIIRDTINSLLGLAPGEELVREIEETISRYDGVLGTHDLVVHSYGPNRNFASVHVEVSASEDILVSHDMIDNIERDLAINKRIHLVVHLDPIITDDPEVDRLQTVMKNALHAIDSTLSLHDFRVVKGKTHTNMIFDVNIPVRFPLQNSHILANLNAVANALEGNYFCVVTFDRTYSSIPGSAE